MSLCVVLGGIRSGKSEYAEALAKQRAVAVIFVATGERSDAEMTQRIERHRRRRPSGWRTIEADDPAAALGDSLLAGGDTVLVDGLTGWVCSLMQDQGLFSEEPSAWGEPAGQAQRRVLAAVAAFAAAAAAREGLTIVVVDETGMGGVPGAASARHFADLNGEAVQVLAGVAQAVWLVVAGQPLSLKSVNAPPTMPSDGGAVGPEALAGALDSPAGTPQGVGGAPQGVGGAPQGVGGAPQGVGGAPQGVEGAPQGVGGAPQGVGGTASRKGEAGAALTLRLHGDTQVPSGYLDFAVSVVPCGPPPVVRQVIADGLLRMDAYPDDTAATQALARRHGRPAEEVLVLNGAAEAFWLLAAALHPARAACVHPGFTEPEVALSALQFPPARVFRDPESFALDPAALDPAADLVIVGNPNNPTGNLESAQTLAALARPGRTLVVDEAFMDFVPAQAESLASRRDLPGLVVVRSLTKILSAPGVRAGYLLGPADVVAALKAVRQPWSVNVAALAVLEAYAGPPGSSPGTVLQPGAVSEALGRVAAGLGPLRERLARGLAALPGLRIWPSAANFVLIRVPDGAAVRDQLLHRGIAVRRGDTFPGLSADFLRVSVRSAADNDRLVSALAEVLG